VRRRALSEDVDDMLGLGREMRRLGEQRIRRAVTGQSVIEENSFAEQRGEPERAKAHPGAVQELAAGEKVIRKLRGVFLLKLVVGVHRLNNRTIDANGEAEVSKNFGDPTQRC
jgi:hypothetical protein